MEGPHPYWVAHEDPVAVPPFRDICGAGGIPNPLRTGPAVRLALAPRGLRQMGLQQVGVDGPAQLRGQAESPGGTAWEPGRVPVGARQIGKESDVAGKKRPKSIAQAVKKAAGKPKRPKKTSRGK